MAAVVLNLTAKIEHSAPLLLTPIFQGYSNVLINRRGLFFLDFSNLEFYNLNEG
jgi:hypothetical protein